MTSEASMTAADRRGRRASWIAALLFVVLCIVVVTAVGPWFRQERYVRIREHRMRENRFRIEEMIARTKPGGECGAILVTIDGLTDADWDASAARHTLDSLLTVGKALVIRDGSATAGSEAAGSTTPRSAALGSDPHGAWTLLGARMGDAAREAGCAAVAVIGRELSEDERAEVATFDRVRNDLPRITRYHHEGEATWVSLEAVRELVLHREQPLMLWLSYTELSEPHLKHERFRIPDPRASELAAIDQYLGMVLACVRAKGCAERTSVLVASGEPNSTGVFRACLVNADAPDTVGVNDLPELLPR